jgi:hypothetical protein
VVVQCKIREQVQHFGTGCSKNKLTTAGNTFFATRKLFGGQRISGGYMLRWADPFFEKDFGYEHRFTQPFAFITYVGERRFGNSFFLLHQPLA